MTHIFAAAIGLIGIVFIAAQEALPGWAQYGLMGLIIIALVVTKQLVPGWIYAETKEELKEALIENKKLVQTIIDNQAVVAPALAKSSEMLEKTTAELHSRGGS